MITYAYKQYGLYGCDEDINIKKSKKEILENFKTKYENKIRTKLKSIGITFKKLKYYSPKEYNFSNDSIDLVIHNRINKSLFKKAILKHKSIIQKALNNNKSYDGYMSLTINTINEELEKLNKPNYQPDVLVLTTILHLLVDTTEFIYTDHVIYEDIEEE